MAIATPELDFITPDLDFTTPEGIDEYAKWGRTSPDEWIETILNCSMWTIPKLIARAVFHRKTDGATTRVVVPSCTSAGKSHTAARIAIAFLNLYTPSTVITTAPTFRQVESILWKEIGTAYANARMAMYRGGDVKQTKIDIDKDHFAIGISTDEPERFQGLHNRFVLVVGDEASGLPPSVYAAMENPLAAGDFRALLLIGNPTQPTGNFKDAFINESGLYTVFQISCFDTPNFTEFGITMEDIRENKWKQKIAGKPVPRPYLITPEWVYERSLEWGEQSILFQCYCLGRFPEQGISSIFSEWSVTDAMKSIKVEPSGSPVAAVDVAWGADTETVFALRKGGHVFPLERWMGQDNVFSAGRIATLIRKHKPIITRVDASGDPGVYDILLHNGFAVEAFNGAERALENEIFGNLRAELFYSLSQKVQNGELQLPDDPKLFSQLLDIRRDHDTKMRLLILSKKQMRSMGIKSPDRADALMMLFKPVAESLISSGQNVSYFL